MSNKIDAYNSANPIRTTVSKTASVGPQAGKASAEAKAVPVAASDTVKLTGDAHQLQELEKTIAAIPQVDHARVQRVRDALRDGTYKIDPQAIAMKLARTEWELHQT